MRSFGLHIVLLFLVYSVNAISQTTLEEYNYVSKGYKVQLESGLDMKKGYRFDDIYSIHMEYSDNEVKETEFKALLRDSLRMPVAIMCIFSHSGSLPKEYICLPQFNSSKEIWKLTNERLASISGENAAALMYGLAKLSAYYSMNPSVK